MPIESLPSGPQIVPVTVHVGALAVVRITYYDSLPAGGRGRPAGRLPFYLSYYYYFNSTPGLDPPRRHELPQHHEECQTDGPVKPNLNVQVDES